MSDNFPLVNLRQAIDKQWEQIEITQNFTIPASRVLKLREVPDDGSVHSKPQIAGLTEVTSYPPLPGQFFVNYCTGYVEFNNSQVGDAIAVTYWGKGSLVEAEDINYLNNKHVISSLPPVGYYGQQWYNTTNGITYCYDIRNKWLSMNKNMFSFGRSGLSNNQYLNFYAGTLPSNNSGLRMVRNATIVSLSGQTRDIGTCTFHIRRNNLSTDVGYIDILNDYGRGLDVDMDVNEGDILQCYFDSAFSSIKDPMLLVEVAWRQ
jgi:hypothetical protein